MVQTQVYHTLCTGHMGNWYKIDARVCLTHASAAAGAAAAAAETPSVTAVRDQCNMGSARFRS